MGETFSFDYGGIGNCLPVEVTIVNPLTNVAKNYVMIWDTGATNTVISQKVYDELKLHKIGDIDISGVSETISAPIVHIDIILPNGCAFKKLKVTTCNLPYETDGLIGMDIITKGDLAISNFITTLLKYTTPPAIR